MKVFKFGGASVKDAASITNLANIVMDHHAPLIIVVSAMGKTTNALELVAEHYFNGDKQVNEALTRVENYHGEILSQLFPEAHEVFPEIDSIFRQLKVRLTQEPSMTFNFEYDQIVTTGEVISTKIIEAFLKYRGMDSHWVDIRKYLRTDDNFREARVDYQVSEPLIKKAFSGNKIFVTQGFLGSTPNNLTTSLGREGSDYTAALLAYFLRAESVTVWKDVPGVLNADPKWFDDTVRIPVMNYSDAIELAFYGASVIHPKTIQPLKRRGIPLYVRSFLHPGQEGTMIGEADYKELIPCFIFKMNQMLIDVYPPDLSFVGEDHFHTIFEMMSRHRIKVNLMQNTAIHFRMSVNNDPTRVPRLVEELSTLYTVKTSTPLELITIRYFDQKTIDRVMVEKELLLEQRTQTTIQLLVRDLSKELL